MSLEKILEKQPLKNLRTIVATVNSIIFLGTALVGTITLIALAVTQLSAGPVAAIFIVALFALLLAATTYSWYFVTQLYDPRFYKILECEGTLQVELTGTHRRYEYVRRQRVEATRDNLRLIEFRQHWTGRGAKENMSVQSVSPDHVLLDGRRTEGDYRTHRWIHLRRPLGRGQRVEVAVRQVHEDSIESQLPYFRQGGGRYKMNKVTVTVAFPLKYAPTELCGAIWNTTRTLHQHQIIGELDVQCTVDTQNEVVHYSVQTEKTRVHHSYGMYWTWPDSPDTGE